ncbi:PAS domain S-box-containing protein [Methanohalophilus levihalophilus]|uniref:ATP-binding protein n=1 Tax=Methanohalophilus levihalophilus TaxID=1431282 RepID=UPI001AEB0D7F|nr:ATP-binding protein [Methanohalophilus levihalophilus]MBP2029404.1 PAS domain S-box-containing protein [Methanohalophilus levihalophilus]
MEKTSFDVVFSRLDFKLMFSVGIIIAILLSFMFFHIASDIERQFYSELDAQAEVSFEQIVLTRQWNADYGGVFVEKKDGIHSNPYLMELGLNPDITTIDGTNYTIKNPALMTREISSYSKDSGVFSFRITSLDPVNPLNEPNAFEAESLRQFENGTESTNTQLIVNGSRYYNYMAPLHTNEGCIECHSDYEVGDVQGGISLLLPMDSRYDAIQKDKMHVLIIALLTIGSVELFLFGITTRFVSNPIRELTKGASEISNGNLKYRVSINSSDEIGQLGTTFNKMAVDLDNSIKEMTESYEWFQNVFINSYDAINISINGKTVYVNPAYMLLFGYGEPEIVGQPFEFVFAKESRSKIHDAIESFESTNAVLQRVEAVGVTKDKKEVFLDISFSFMETKGERYTIAILKDDTEKKVAEEARLKNAELLRSNELKDMFTDIMRHDLLNPVGVISGYSELLLDMEDDDRKKRYVANIHRSAKSLTDMIEYAALLARLESVDKIDYESLDLAVIIRDVTKNLELQFNGHELEFGFGDDAYLVEAHTMIESVFQNLISNAIKYSPEKSRIEVNIIDDGDLWRVDVIDEGEGISDEDKPYVFDRFKRVSKGNIKGNGLGLAIVKKIVDLHSGKIIVSDNPAGKGSVFSVWLRKARDKNI